MQEGEKQINLSTLFFYPQVFTKKLAKVTFQLHPGNIFPVTFKTTSDHLIISEKIWQMEVDKHENNGNDNLNLIAHLLATRYRTKCFPLASLLNLLSSPYGRHCYCLHCTD